MKRFVFGLLLTIGVMILIQAMRKGISPLKVVIDAASSAAQLKSRGLRNNNPGNIRIGAAAWLGEKPVAENTDGVFEQFDTPEHGIRALSKLITNYGVKYGDKSISRIVSRFAPSNENDTAAYISAVEKYSGIGRDVSLNFAVDKDALLSVVAAIIKQENGIQPYTAETLKKGIA